MRSQMENSIVFHLFPITENLTCYKEAKMDVNPLVIFH